MTYTTVREALDAYDEYLDEYPGDTVNVCGIEFDRSRILRELDPTAYRCYFADWLDTQGIDSDELDDPNNDWPQ
jgi:hypothetical protein